MIVVLVMVGVIIVVEGVIMAMVVFTVVMAVTVVVVMVVVLHGGMVAVVPLPLSQTHLFPLPLSVSARGFACRVSRPLFPVSCFGLRCWASGLRQLAPGSTGAASEAMRFISEISRRRNTKKRSALAAACNAGSDSAC